MDYTRGYNPYAGKAAAVIKYAAIAQSESQEKGLKLQGLLNSIVLRSAGKSRTRLNLLELFRHLVYNTLKE